MPILSCVHCIDTEGPLTEPLAVTFKRLKSIFGIELDVSSSNYDAILNGKISSSKYSAAEIQSVFSPRLLNYLSDWDKISDSVTAATSTSFRGKYLDSRGEAWKYSWHIMDHIGFDCNDNPGRKDLGLGSVISKYQSIVNNRDLDYFGWHFHPIPLSTKCYHSATSLLNSIDALVSSICHRIFEFKDFPCVNRPGFHSIRPDWNLFYEQWLPFEYSNQFCDDLVQQKDLSLGRFGNWHRSPATWSGYHPDTHDYQTQGSCKRKIFRILNLGTRFNLLKESHFHEARFSTKWSCSYCFC